MAVKLGLTLKKEYGLRAFQNRVRRKIVGPKRDEITGELKKVPNEERHNNITAIKSGSMIRVGYVVRMWECEMLKCFGRKTGRKDTNLEI
jgi:hypothetical protein